MIFYDFTTESPITSSFVLSSGLSPFDVAPPPAALMNL
jgi:hypothetical protein